MKKLSIVILLGLLAIACNQEPKDYVTLTGKIENAKDTVLYLNSLRMPQPIKEIKVNKDGTFKDTMKLEENFYLISNGESRTVVKLKNGYELNINFDATNITESAKFNGSGAGTNNYMADRMRLQKSYGLDNPQTYFEMEKPDFEKKVADLKGDLSSLLDKAEELDSTFIANEKMSSEQLISYLTGSYDMQHAILAPIAKGKPSPKFSYPDVNGKVVSLDDLKGNYVYIDIWATWCTPCLNEIPYLKEIEKEYHDKNIKFVSLSIDKQEVKDKWKQMVVEKELSGIQIMADNNFESEFIQAYGINAIPRFILIDPNGNIVSNNAPRPSDPALKELFTELNI